MRLRDGDTESSNQGFLLPGSTVRRSIAENQGGDNGTQLTDRYIAEI